MNFKELVADIKEVKNRIILLEVKMDKCKVVKSPSYDSIRGSSSSNSVEDRLCLYSELERKYRQEKRLLANRIEQFEEVVGKNIKNSTRGLILHLFYIEELRIQEVATRTGYSYEWTKKQKGLALKELESVEIS